VPRLKVNFQNIRVISDGDSNSKGDFTYQFSVNGETVESSKQRIKAGDGETFNLPEGDKEVTLNPNEVLTLRGTITEHDGFLNGADDIVSFTTNYGRTSNWGIGGHTKSLAVRTLRLELRYVISQL
jgi:hypothetical protein